MDVAAGLRVAIWRKRRSHEIACTRLERGLAERVEALKALEADRLMRAEHERVLAEREQLAKEMEQMAGPYYEDRSHGQQDRRM